MTSNDIEELTALLVKQIEATNRVNHAVRAIVIPSTILLITVLIASPFLAFGWVLDAGGLYTFAGLILFIGAIIAIVNQIVESGASEMPSTALAHAAPKKPSSESNEAGVPHRDAQGLLAGYCSCTRFERGLGNTRQVDGGKACLRCERLIADPKPSKEKK